MNDIFDLSGKVALVTGGSRGLGLAMSRALAAAGADIVIASRDGDACEAAAAQIAGETGRTALGVGAHVGKWDDLPALVDTAYDRFGKIDILINNAGMSPLYDSIGSVTEALFDKVFDVNLKGPFRLSALIGERMFAAGSGSIINISSAASYRARAHNLPYAMAKAGLNSMTVGLAHAFAPVVRVNTIVAGTFLTDVSKAWDMEAFQRRAEAFAARRGGQPDEIIGAALYLASDAASYTTASTLTVDGGQP
ncbi:SDR family NAD(P)-dependent oxidoreductase [Microbacterium sp. NPDC055910]|uniref:SDR family NAD(P)-dependent oxidoreductase n=1 Tax=Microbacterium sp. NPDC055910 TaxID=3345659 RepID=UPI0035D7A22D